DHKAAVRAVNLSVTQLAVDFNFVPHRLTGAVPQTPAFARSATAGRRSLGAGWPARSLAGPQRPAPLPRGRALRGVTSAVHGPALVRPSGWPGAPPRCRQPQRGRARAPPAGPPRAPPRLPRPALAQRTAVPRVRRAHRPDTPCESGP